jgi:hypothetical protein
MEEISEPTQADLENVSKPDPDPKIEKKAEKSTICQASAKLGEILRQHYASRKKGSGIVSPLRAMAERIQARADRGNGLGQA